MTLGVQLYPRDVKAVTQAAIKCRIAPTPRSPRSTSRGRATSRSTASRWRARRSRRTLAREALSHLPARPAAAARRDPHDQVRDHARAAGSAPPHRRGAVPRCRDHAVAGFREACGAKRPQYGAARRRSGIDGPHGWRPQRAAGEAAGLTPPTSPAPPTPIRPPRAGLWSASTTIKDRRTARFPHRRADQQLLLDQSARYEIRRDRWQGVDLAIYCHHSPRLRRRAQTRWRSRSRCSPASFSPYQFRQARILEFPSYADFAQSFANTIPYSENIGFLTELGDPDKIDITTYVTAHEIATRWGHQLVPCSMSAATAQRVARANYSALLVMEHVRPRARAQFLKYEAIATCATAAPRPSRSSRSPIELQSYIYCTEGLARDARSSRRPSAKMSSTARSPSCCATTRSSRALPQRARSPRSHRPAPSTTR